MAGIRLINLDYFSDPDGLLDCWHRGEYTFCYILEDKIDWYLYQLVGKDRPRRFRMLSRVDTVTLMYVCAHTWFWILPFLYEVNVNSGSPGFFCMPTTMGSTSVLCRLSMNL